MPDRLRTTVIGKRATFGSLFVDEIEFSLVPKSTCESVIESINQRFELRGLVTKPNPLALNDTRQSMSSYTDVLKIMVGCHCCCARSVVITIYDRQQLPVPLAILHSANNFLLQLNGKVRL